MSNVLPIEEKEGEDSREVSWRGVGWQVEHKQNNNTARGRDKVVELRKDDRKEHDQPLRNYSIYSMTDKD